MLDPHSKSYSFSSSHVWMWEWTIKKAEHQRIDAFQLECWRRLLKVTWTSRRSNQSILKKINPEYSLKGLMLKLRFQYFGHLMQRTDSNGWMASLTQWTWVWVNSRSWWWTGRPGMLQFMGLQRVRNDWATELNWTEPNRFYRETMAKD